MAARLKSVEIKNFKTYSGRHLVDQLRPYTAIVGPNGAGKSNFMDAVAFALGEEISLLRVHNAGQLVHGATVGRQAASSASVTATFLLGGTQGGERTFTRTASRTTSRHLVDGQSVSAHEYLEMLKALGINVKCKNFMVFQGTVESIATSKNKKKTQLFEEISGSGALKKEYEHRKEVMLKAEEDASAQYQKKLTIVAQRKELQVEKKDADNYSKLEREYENKTVKLHLFRLYHIKKEIEALHQELNTKENHLRNLREKKTEQAEIVNQKSKKQEEIAKELANLDQEIKEQECQLNKKRSSLVLAKEMLAQVKKKIECHHKSVLQAREAHQAHMRDIQELEKALQLVERKSAEYEGDISQDAERLGTSLELEAEELEQYHRLKNKAGRECVPQQQQLDSITRDQKTDQDRHNDGQRRLTETKEALGRMEKELREAKQRAERLAKCISQTQASLKDKKHEEQELEEAVTSLKDRLGQATGELAKVTEELSEATWDEDQSQRRREKQEVVEKLRLLCPGVYDRLINLCQPIHARYQVAVTRVLLRDMESIVVDTETTARKCIRYLAERRIGRETFLALNYLTPSPLRQSLRAIQEPRNVKLAYDLIKYQPEEVKVAVLFATRNILVCETPEEAMKVAYENPDGRRLSAVSLDGTFFGKSGIMSGGKLDLQRKAQRWEEKHISNLKNTKEKLTMELKEARKVTRREAELNTVQAQVRGIRTKLKYLTMDIERVNEQITDIETRKTGLEEDLAALTTHQQEIEKTLADRGVQMAEIRAEAMAVEDRVFADFCALHGLPHIRLYEEQGLRTLTDRANVRLGFEKQKSHIKNQIEFERSRDTEANIRKWEDAVQRQETVVEETERTERERQLELERCIQELAQKRAKRIGIGAGERQAEEEVTRAQKEGRAAAREAEKLNLKIIRLKQRVAERRGERNSILTECSLHGIKLPLLRGSQGDPREDPSTQSSSQDASSDSQFVRDLYGKESSEIQVNFSTLSNTYKRLENAEVIKKTEEDLKAQLKDIQDTLSSLQPPNKKTNENLQQTRDQLKDADSVLTEAGMRAREAKQEFEQIRKERYDLFMRCFMLVSNKINELYRAMYRSASAQALLETDNTEEPYHGSIVYHCVPPGKRCQTMGCLSGGEKTVAALSFLFALHSYQPAPFLILDEIDASLDNTNINKVSSYIAKKKEELQILVISHKKELFHKADALFGVTGDVAGDYVQSRVFSLDLSQFRREEDTSSSPE